MLSEYFKQLSNEVKKLYINPTRKSINKYQLYIDKVEKLLLSGKKYKVNELDIHIYKLGNFLFNISDDNCAICKQSDLTRKYEAGIDSCNYRPISEDCNNTPWKALNKYLMYNHTKYIDYYKLYYLMSRERDYLIKIEKELIEHVK